MQIGTPDLYIDNVITKTEEIGITAKSTETASATNAPAKVDSKKYKAPPPPSATSFAEKSRLLCRFPRVNRQPVEKERNTANAKRGR